MTYLTNIKSRTNNLNIRNYEAFELVTNGWLGSIEETKVINLLFYA